MERTPALGRLVAAIAFIEQPLDRAIALDPLATEGLGELGRRIPMLIDESDAELDSFRAAVTLGYRGVSTKNCKGIVKSILNRSLVERENRGRAPAARLFMSAEDLTNVRWCELQRISHRRALGSAMWSGRAPHYVRGLAHCSSAERGLARHTPISTRRRARGAVRIEGGGSPGLLAAHGYGVGFDLIWAR